MTPKPSPICLVASFIQFNNPIKLLAVFLISLSLFGCRVQMGHSDLSSLVGETIELEFPVNESPFPPPSDTQGTLSPPIGYPPAAIASAPTPDTAYFSIDSGSQGVIQYLAQPGDTLASLAARFRVRPQEIMSPEPLPEHGLLVPGQMLTIPRQPESFSNSTRWLPDSEVVFSASALDFDIGAYLARTNGYLNSYQEYLRSSGWTNPAEIIYRVAIENSINPRLLLALLEYRCKCVFAFPENPLDGNRLFGVSGPKEKGLYRQLSWAANQLSLGYYEWRAGWLTEFYFPEGTLTRIPPDLNAGTVAVQYFFASLYTNGEWSQALDLETGFPALYKRMFGDPWRRATRLEPILPENLTQPVLILPFMPGEIWSYTSGPHKAWDTGGALAALDFAPASAESGCLPSEAWILAVADGVVARSENGAVVLDLDDHNGQADGLEQTGWAFLYMHVESRERVALGTKLKKGDRIGHPSCEGGRASGTHVHIARKYNGEWIPADGPIPLVLDGWQVHAGHRPFEGSLTRGERTILANPYGARHSFIERSIEDLPAGDSPIEGFCPGQCE